MMDDLPMIPEWVNRAACARIDPELWFPNKGGDNGSAALAICRTCPVRRQCRAYAVDDPKLDGVWGGTTPNDRKAIRTKRQSAA